MDYKAIKKVELHRHLELSIRKQTIMELAPQFGFDVPDEEAFKKHFLIEEQMLDLGSVLHKFLDTQKLLASEEILERVAYEACEDAYKLENIRILELRYAPTFVQLGHDHLSFQQIHDAFVKGIERAEKDFPIAVGLLAIIQRILPVEVGEKVANFAIENKDTFVGLDLADNEEGFDSKPFSEFFLKAKEQGLGITIHSGEANLPKAPWYPKDAIEHLGANRIGHGVMIYKEPEMIDYIKKSGAVLELCPTSNYLTNAISKLENHPIKQLKDAGVAVTVNTDDPGIFGIDMNHEYRVAHELLGFSEKDFIECNETAYKASFISDDKKSKVWR
jgi:adenosine deaminase